MSICLVLAAAPAACGGTSSARPPAESPPPREVSFDVVACRVEETNGSCPAPLVGATVKLNTRVAPDGSLTFTPPQTTNEAGSTRFTLTGDAAHLQDSFLVITAPGFQDRNVSIHVPSLAQPGTHNIVTLAAIASRRAPTRRGLVRLEGRAFADDGGPYLAVGASLFWAAWGYRHDRPEVGAKPRIPRRSRRRLHPRARRRRTARMGRSHGLGSRSAARVDVGRGDRSRVRRLRAASAMDDLRRGRRDADAG